jgi:hypothetical protein
MLFLISDVAEVLQSGVILCTGVQELPIPWEGGWEGVLFVNGKN